MQSTLLRAKLHRPTPSPGTIPRPLLIQQLHAGLGCRVTLVSAAAGFGKSTLLSTWLAELAAQPDCQAGPLRGSWLSLDAGDNSLPRFVRYLIAAIEASFPNQCAPVAALLQERPTSGTLELADLLANCLGTLSGRLILVLDDLHVLSDGAIFGLLTRLVQFAPSSLHVVLSARVDPLQLPLTRWRAQGWLHELRQRELSFSSAEVASFLSHSLLDTPSAELVATLSRYSEGWPVGLRLATLALRGHNDPAAFLAATRSNRDRFALDYLRDEVLEQQPEAVQTFLLKTAILKRFCPALCAAVLEIDEPQATQTLDAIVRANMFLIDLSSPPQWYRYHHQFQSSLLSRLNERLDPAALAALHRRAAAWLSDHDEVPEALEYLMAIGDTPAAVALLEQHRDELVSTGRTQDLADALALIPEPLVLQRPLLLLSGAWLDAWRLEWEACGAKVERAARLLEEQSASPCSAAHDLVRCELVALRSAMDYKLEGLVGLDEIVAAWERVQPQLALLPAPVICALAEQCHLLGDHRLGLAIFDVALAQNRRWPTAARFELLSRRATMLFWQGDLTSSEQGYQAGLGFAQQHGFAAAAAISRLALGSIAGIRHRLDECEHYLRAVLVEMSVENARYVLMAVSRLVEVYCYQQRLGDARQTLDQFKAFVRPLGLRYLNDHYDAVEAYLAMMSGDAPTALAWVLGGLHQPHRYHLIDRLTTIRARILVAEGSPASMQLACELLDGYVRYMERHHLRLYMVEGLALQAEALAGIGQSERALALLDRTVQLVVPNGLVGRIIQRGQPMQRLLQQFCVHPAYRARAAQARLLLAAFPTVEQAPELGVVPLSERECDVLRLMAEGLSNKAIAQRLLISAYTVRNHTVNIFGKLQVENRVQAVERARTLGMLSPVVRG